MISDQLQLLENAIRDFEPLFWIFSPNEPTDRLYEPDGTLYAICLDGPTELCTDRRKVTVNQGDLVIIPPAVAIDCSPHHAGLASLTPAPILTISASDLFKSGVLSITRWRLLEMQPCCTTAVIELRFSCPNI